MPPTRVGRGHRLASGGLGLAASPRERLIATSSFRAANSRREEGLSHWMRGCFDLKFSLSQALTLSVGLVLLAVVLFNQQRFGSRTTLPRRVALASTTLPATTFAMAHARPGAGAVSAVPHLTPLSSHRTYGIQDVRRALRLAAGARVPAQQELEELRRSLPQPRRSLRFSVCNGFANQRLSVVYGILLAARLQRTPVIPRLLMDGLQRTDVAVTADADSGAEFEAIYDQMHFQLQLARGGISILSEHEAPPDSVYTHVRLSDYLTPGGLVKGLAANLSDVEHVAIDCPLFKMQPVELSHLQDEPVIWTILDALRPAPEALQLVDRIGQAIVKVAAIPEQLKARPVDMRYNFLHLRMENDWVEHCKRWSAIPDGVVRDNCYNNTEEIDVALKLFGFSPSIPLFVASYWDDVDEQRLEKVMSRLLAAGFHVVTGADVLPKELLSAGREYRALIEYHVGLKATRFIGNSVSTFASLALLERRHRGQWAAYYNGGNLPVAAYLPVHKLPWVFTYNSWSAAYDYMLKAALRSALQYGTLKPYCIFDGNTSSTIYHWLVDQNVTMIRHMPAWRNELIKRASVKMKDNVQHSHLYKSPDMLVSTFQRVDLPVVPILDQYTYVLYTDADVYFRRPVHLDDFGLPLTQSVAMSYEFDNMFPYNAGVMLANMPTMRRNYKAFIAMMLDNDNGMYYPNYGPGDQGIINKYYEHDLRQKMMDQAFNTKPYNDFDSNAFIVHYHGPKPHEFVRFLETGKCDFYKVCEQGFLKALCQYAQEWAKFIPEEITAIRLSDGCSWLTNPTVMAVFQKKTGLVPPQQAIPDDKQARQDFVHVDHGQVRAAA